MAKRKRRKNRKRTNANIPAKGVLLKHADRLWSLAVRSDWGNNCAVCGNRKCVAHHVIPRQYETFHYDLRNGIALCGPCHVYDPDTSPHQNAAGWLLWLSTYYPELHRWYIDTTKNSRYKSFDGLKNATYYCNVIRGLQEYVTEEDFDRILGIQFATWLAENS